MNVQAMTLAKKVCNNGQNRDIFHRKCELAKQEDAACEILELIKVVATRWNSHASCLIRLFKMQSAVTQLCTDRTLPMFGRYQMCTAEWDIIEEIQPILRVSFFFIHKSVF
jgi:hypothetical protein